MYSPKIISRNLEAFAQSEGWMPQYHSMGQIQELKDYISSIVSRDEKGRNNYFTMKRDLTANSAQRLRRLIENEQALCMFDSSYFEDRYAWVCDEKGEMFKFKNRLGQQIFDNIVAEAEERHAACELLVLKARQQGITTKTALKFLHRLLFLPHTQAVMGSVIESKSELITRIIETCIQRLPWWLIPSRTTDKKNMIEFDNGSVLSIQSGGQATGIAQGWTPTLVHISELGDIPNPKKSIEEGLLHATHSTYKLFMVFEGTGNGSTGWLADKWRSSKAKWPLGESRLRPVFIPWPMTPELFPTRDFINDHPVPGDFRPLEVTRKHVQRCELFIRNTDYLAKVAGANWQMPIEQQWFWQWNYLQAVDSHTQKTWLAQKPADDFEALQGENDKIFDTAVIDTARNERKRDYQLYAVTGDSIDDGFEPLDEEIDYDKERIRVTWNSHRGQSYSWVMVPLLPVSETDQRKSLDKVMVFEEPYSRPGFIGDPQDYSIGIDTADGLNQEDEDSTVISGTRAMKGENFDVQVFELASKRMNAPQAVGFAACLASYYGTNTIDARGCKFAIEQRERPGDDCQLQLKLMGFSYHHIDIPYDSKVIKENRGHKEGIYMRPWTRGQIITRFVEAVNNGWYKPQSPFLIEELASLERKLKKGKSRIEHQSGHHDDRVLAAAHSYWTLHHLDNLADRSSRRYAPPTQKLPELDRSYANIAEMSVGE